MAVNSYIDKYKGYGKGRLSVYDILQRVGTTEYKNGEIKEYEAVGIDYVLIDGNKFKNYGVYQFIWEKTFVKSPQRSANGSIGNLDSYATFLTPHLIMDFSVMSIDDYRKIMLLHYGGNEYTVECYDPIYNRRITAKMYFGTEEMAKLYTISQNRLLPDGMWKEWVDLVGVTDYKVELIGTNNDLDLVNVVYQYNAPLDENGLPIYPNGVPIPDQAEEDIYFGEEIVIGSNSTFIDTPPSSKYQFSHWSMLNENGEVVGTRSNGLIMTINSPTIFRAEWKPTSIYILSFNYGLSDVATTVNSSTGAVTEILNKEIDNINDIGTLPPLTAEPYVEDSSTKTKYYPYHNGGWYKHPVKQENMKVTSNQAYWLSRDTIIYALYDKKPFTVTYHTNDTNTSIPTQTLYYGDSVYLPTLARSGYTFQGWYIDSGFKTAFRGTMPPYPIDLYAKWVAK